MSTTLNTLKTLAREYNGGKDDKGLLEYYNDLYYKNEVIAYIYCTNYNLFRTKVNKFSTILNEDDIDSVILGSIDTAMVNFDITRGTKLIPYMTNVIYNEVRYYAQSVRKGDMVAILNSTRFESVVECKENSPELAEINKEIALATSVEDSHEDMELNSLIESLNLSSAQKNFLSILIENPSLKDVEVAKILGVGRSSIANMKKRIREKLQNSLYSI